MLQNVLSAALGGTCANKNGRNRTLGRPWGHHVRHRSYLLSPAKCLPPVLLGCENVFLEDESPAKTRIVQIRSWRGAGVTGEDRKGGNPVLAGTRRAHPSSRLITHFRSEGLLWHISRKCVTPFRPEPAFHAPPGHISPPAFLRTSTRPAFHTPLRHLPWKCVEGGFGGLGNCR